MEVGLSFLPEEGDEDLVGDDVELLLLLALHVDRALRAVQPRDARPPHRRADVLGHALSEWGVLRKYSCQRLSIQSGHKC